MFGLYVVDNHISFYFELKFTIRIIRCFTIEQKHRNTANDPNEKLILLIHACDFAFDNGVGLMIYYVINHRNLLGVLKSIELNILFYIPHGCRA